jgi:hypothetical protein
VAKKLGRATHPRACILLKKSNIDLLRVAYCGSDRPMGTSGRTPEEVCFAFFFWKGERREFLDWELMMIKH